MRGSRVKMLRQEIKLRRVGYLAREWRRFKRAWTREGYAGLDRVLPAGSGPRIGAARLPK